MLVADVAGDVACHVAGDVEHDVACHETGDVAGHVTVHVAGDVSVYVSSVVAKQVAACVAVTSVLPCRLLGHVSIRFCHRIVIISSQTSKNIHHRCSILISLLI